MAEIHSLAYAGFGVSDLDKWQWLATDIIGMQVANRDEQGLILRMDEYAQRFFLEKIPSTTSWSRAGSCAASRNLKVM